MPTDPTILSESPRPAVRDRGSDAGKLEDSVRGWTREAVTAIRGIFKRVTALETQIGTLAAPTTSVAAPTSSPAVPTPRSTESVSGDNVGTGVGVFQTKTGAVLKFRSLKSGPNIKIEEVGDEIRIGLNLLNFNLSNITPAGAVQMWSAALSSVPAGWLLCDGSVLNIADYPTLGGLLGTTYGGDGVTTFGLPDGRDRFPLGPSAAEDPGATGGTAQHKHAVGTLVNSDDSAGTPAGTIDPHTATTETLAVGASPVLTGPPTHAFTGTPLGNHTHTISGKTDVNEDLAASTATADVLPPFLKLAFIIKT